MNSKKNWLRGGPFLEVSFLQFLRTDRLSTVSNFINRLKLFNTPIEFVLTEKELADKLSEFDTGWPDDPNDSKTKYLHETQIPTFVQTDIKRKAVLHLRQVSAKLTAIDFSFFASTMDAPEWNQVGIMEMQLPRFKEFLDALYDEFTFPLGSVGYENSVTNLFETGEMWPNEKYIPENFHIDGDFIYIVSDRQYIDMSLIKDVVISGRKHVLHLKGYST